MLIAESFPDPKTKKIGKKALTPIFFEKNLPPDVLVIKISKGKKNAQNTENYKTGSYIPHLHQVPR